MFSKTEPVSFTVTVWQHQETGECQVRIPKHIVDMMDIERETVVELTISKLTKP